MQELLGEGHRGVVHVLRERVRTATAGDISVPRIVLLEGASGIGKTRVVRELYRTMCADLDHGYWPALDEAGGGDARSRDPLPGRKLTGPPVEDFAWPARALPGFAWWQLHCERMHGGQLMDVVAQARPEIEAHLVPLSLAWRRAASIGDKVNASRDDLVEAARELLKEGGLEAASELLSQAGLPIPGLGAAISWLFRGLRAFRERQQLAHDAASGVDLGDRVGAQRRSVSAELASLIAGVAHPSLPAVVVVEDIHLMDDGLGELIDGLGAPAPEHPILVVAMAWPESRDAPAYARWRQRAVDRGHAEVIDMPYLPKADLMRIVRAYAPNTVDGVAAEAARLHPNPLTLEALLSSRAVSRSIARSGGALSQEALAARPVKLEDVYRDRFAELAEEVQFALAVAAGSLPNAAAGQLWPFVRGIIGTAVEMCGLVPPGGASLVEGIEYAAEDQVWLVSTAASDTFREAFQSQVAHEYFEAELVLPEEGRELRAAVIEALKEWIDAARGDGYVLEPTDEADVISRWLLEVADGDDVSPALLAAAFRVATVLASTYQYRSAAATLEPHVGRAPADIEGLFIRVELASWVAESGQVEAAISSLETLCSDHRRILGEDHHNTLTVCGRLASEVARAGRLRDAIAAYRELVPRMTAVLGPADPDTLAARGNLARYLGEAGDLEEAVSAHRELVADVRAALGPDHPHNLTARAELARWLGEAGRLAEAISSYEELLADEVRLFGPDHLRAITTRSNLGLWLGQAGRLEEAVSSYRIAVVDHVRILGPDHPSTLLARGNLALWVFAMGRIDEAATAFADVLGDLTRVVGPDNPHTLAVRSNLARVLSADGRVEEALKMNQSVLTDCIRILGANHPTTLEARAELAARLGQLRRVDDALAAHESVLSDRLVALGADHPHTLATRSEIAYTLSAANRMDDAIAWFEALLADQLRVLGPDDPRTLNTRINLAACVGNVGQFDDARAAFEALLADQLRVLGPDHPKTLTTRAHIAHWTGKAGYVDVAIDALRNLLADQTRVLGPSHPNTKNTETLLTRWVETDLNG